MAEKIRAAGPRPPLPPLDIERLAAPALAVWQAKIARRRQRTRRRVYLALAATLLVAVTVWLLRPAPPPAIATVLAYSGPAPERFALGEALVTGTVLRTGARPAEWLTISLAGHILRLDAGSELRLEATSQVELIRGAVYLETSPAPLTVQAAGFDTEHIGTRFEVRLRADSEADDAVIAAVIVRVRDGRVRVRERETGRSTEVDGGQQVLSRAEDDFSVSEISRTGDSWDWIHQAAPPFDSDGASLEAVLAWLAREAGWQVEIDPALYVDAAGQPVKVHGSIDQLSVEDALAYVLESAGLKSRFDGDRLIIEES